MAFCDSNGDQCLLAYYTIFLSIIWTFSRWGSSTCTAALESSLKLASHSSVARIRDVLIFRISHLFSDWGPPQARDLHQLAHGNGNHHLWRQVAICASATLKEAQTGQTGGYDWILDFYSLKVFFQIYIHRHLLRAMCFSLGQRKSIKFGRVGKYGFFHFQSRLCLIKVALSSTDKNFSMQFSTHNRFFLESGTSILHYCVRNLTKKSPFWLIL